jgi:hypothetical protein
MLGAEQVIAIDQYDYRCRWRATRRRDRRRQLLRGRGLVEQLKELTGGRGPTPASTPWGWRRLTHWGACTAYDRGPSRHARGERRGHALRGRDPRVPPGRHRLGIGVYGGLMDKVPDGALHETRG